MNKAKFYRTFYVSKICQIMTKLESVLIKWEEKLFVTVRHNTIRNLQFVKVINQSLCQEILFGSSIKSVWELFTSYLIFCVLFHR